MIKNTEQCLHKTKAYFYFLYQPTCRCAGGTQGEWNGIDGMELSELEGTHKNHQSSVLGLAQDRCTVLGGDMVRTAAPAGQRNIAYHMEWHQVHHVRAE